MGKHIIMQLQKYMANNMEVHLHFELQSALARWQIPDAGQALIFEVALLKWSSFRIAHSNEPQPHVLITGHKNKRIMTFILSASDN